MHGSFIEMVWSQSTNYNVVQNTRTCNFCLVIYMSAIKKLQIHSCAAFQQKQIMRQSLNSRQEHTIYSPATSLLNIGYLCQSHMFLCVNMLEHPDLVKLPQAFSTDMLLHRSYGTNFDCVLKCNCSCVRICVNLYICTGAGYISYNVAETYSF